MVLTPDELRQRLAATALQPWGQDAYSLEFVAMGTRCRVLFAVASRAVALEFRTWLMDWLADYESRYSRFMPTSLISEINRCAGEREVATDEELESLLTLCDWYHRLTQGIFDPTSLPVLKLWDYHAPHAVLPSPDDVREARTKVGWSRVRRRAGALLLPEKGMAMDLGGIGKEYAVDRVLETALQRGVDHIMVDFGHDLRVHGSPPEGGPWRIGLEYPMDPGRCWAGVAVDNRAVATSGDYHRNFTLGGKRYGHIVDPRTGFPVSNGCRGVSAIAPTCTEAGMVATTAFVLGPDEGIRFVERCAHVDACIWTDEYRIQTRGFDDYLLRPRAA